MRYPRIRIALGALVIFAAGTLWGFSIGHRYYYKGFRAGVDATISELEKMAREKSDTEH